MTTEELTLAHIEQVLATAEQIYTQEQMDQAVVRMAGQIRVRLADRNPLLLTVMNGGLMFAGCLIQHLHFPLQMDYLHASRYGDATSGGELKWKARPGTAMTGRHVLILDDILDQGGTLLALIDYCRAQGAASVSTAVLVEKLHSRKDDPNFRADFLGLTVPDRFVFGFGMDYRGYWRNAPGIYAVAGR
jgi:hypoxanthine phosphoribosyltransferase